MQKSRRYFLTTLAAFGPLVLRGVSEHGQATAKRSPFPTPPPPAEAQNPAETQASRQGSLAAKRAALQEDEKEFRTGVSRLYELTGELKQELDKTPTTEVFSVSMYKRMEEIAKLAKHLQSKAKG